MAKKFYLKKQVKIEVKRKNLLWIIIIIICFTYYQINIKDNWLHETLSESIIKQSIDLFLNLLTLIGIFYNLSFTKEVTEKDIRKIVEKKKQEEIELKRIKEDATIG